MDEIADKRSEGLRFEVSGLRLLKGYVFDINIKQHQTTSNLKLQTLVLISQLSTGCVNVFTATSS